MRLVSSLCLLGWLAWPGAAARADVFSYEDKDGVVHVTNLKPARGGAHKWRVLYKSGAGKAGVISGAAPPTSFAGCAASRADVVPATDRSPERYTRYDAHIAEASRLYALPEALIRAIIKAESDYDPRVVSCADAKGLMQLMPDVQREQRVEHVFEPRENILGGSRLLRVNANRFHGDLVLTIAAYHAGPGAVLKYKGVPPYETTQKYVKIVLGHYYKWKAREPVHPTTAAVSAPAAATRAD
ncbi:MAG TPA: lytic transglycosylase domain-containing protein [Planctomycetota bacterium]|nr:lytic transglycosylase domain-containing protein [Planctomycetota bacterium]